MTILTEALIAVARALPRGVLLRVAELLGVLVSVCAYCEDPVGLRSAQGAPGGFSHTVCPPCGTEVRAENARYFALRTRS
jgi:hypothetical protein